MSGMYDVVRDKDGQLVSFKMNYREDWTDEEIKAGRRFGQDELRSVASLSELQHGNAGTSGGSRQSAVELASHR